MIGVSFMTANFVAREVGWQMTSWEHGDRSVQDVFRPIDSFEDRFGRLLDDVAAMGFSAIDLWEAHLSPAWATDDHVRIAREQLDARGMRVASLAGWFGTDAERLESQCRIASALGAPVLGGGTNLLEGRRETMIGLLERHDLRFGLENHPEPTPAAVLERIGEDASGRIGVAVDTGWFGTQGYDAAEAIRELSRRLVHVHLKDVLNVGDPHHTCGYGDGVVPLRECVVALRELGYEGAISVEHNAGDHDPTDEIRRSRELLEGWLAA